MAKMLPPSGRTGSYGPYKSRAEYSIANVLDRYSVPFVYERPTAVVDDGKTKIWYPDFTLSYGPIIEYFGIVGNSDYDARTQHKLDVYGQNYFDVIDLYPTDMTAGWDQQLLYRIDQSLEGRLRGYRTSVHSTYRARRGNPGYAPRRPRRYR